MKDESAKILFVMQLPPPVHGVSVMNSTIKNSAVINGAFQCDYVNLATARNIDDIQKAAFRKYCLTIKIVYKALIKLLFNKYRYVYITIFPFGFAFYKDATIVLLSKLFNQKPLLHLHTYGFKSNSESSKFKKWFYTQVFKNCEAICLSDLLLEDIENIFRGKVYILPNGIPQVNFENRYNNLQDPFIILYLSNLIKGKGILVLMEAAEILQRQGLNFKLRVVGPEGDVTYEELRNIVTIKNLGKKVDLIGPKYGNDKLNEFRNAGIFVLPSNYDTFGLVLLEAMQFGVPCISTNVGGIPDVLGEGRGLILEEIAPETLATAVFSLIKNPDLREQMSRSSFSYFKSTFTVEKFEENLLAILQYRPTKINTRLVKA